MKIYVNLKTGAVSIGSELNTREAREVGTFLLNVDEFGGGTELKHITGVAEKIMDAFAAAAMSCMEDFAALQAALNTYAAGDVGAQARRAGSSKLTEVALHIPTAAARKQ